RSTTRFRSLFLSLVFSFFYCGSCLIGYCHRSVLPVIASLPNLIQGGLVMGALRQKMIEEIRLRNFSPRTEQSYVSAMVGLAKYYRQSPDQLSQEQIRAYLLHLKERGLSPSSRNVAISGMKFFYNQCLGWNEKQLFIPPRKRSWQLPEALSPKEVERLLLAATKQRDRCLLMTAYATGVRVSELVRLKVSDIDSERMMVRVEQGKGRKTATRYYRNGCSQSCARIGKSIA